MNAFMGAIGFSTLDGIISPAYAVARPLRAIEPAYFHYLLRTQLFTTQFDRYSYGIMYERNRLYFERFKTIPVIIPSTLEQSTIVHYLDYIDQRIRRYIRTKQKLIKLLEEQKQAIIHQAVTRGLDPDVQLKPSGVEWLGDVPEHWEVIPNRHLFRETTRKYTGENEIQLSLSQREGLIETDQMKERSLRTATYDNFKIVIPDDLVLNRFKAHLGVFFASTLQGIVTFHYGVFQPIKEMKTKYFELLYHTHPYKTIYAGVSNGMTVGLQNLSNQNFYKIKSIVPPLSEQIDILYFVEKETHTFDRAIDAILIEISLLREYRTRLIADVVTGKLDVREAAVNLPEEVEEMDDSLAEDGLEESEIENEQAGELEEEVLI
jgi:type I restriction enzyme S subunit